MSGGARCSLGLLSRHASITLTSAAQPIVCPHDRCDAPRGALTRGAYASRRERLIRLQHENKMLKLNQEGSDNEKIVLLQSLLEDANIRKNELESENRYQEPTRGPSAQLNLLPRTP